MNRSYSDSVLELRKNKYTRQKETCVSWVDFVTNQIMEGFTHFSLTLDAHQIQVQVAT